MSCGKKQKEPEKELETEEALLLSEKVEAEVELYRPQWSRSLAIRSITPSTTPNTDPLDSIFTQILFNKIAENTSLKTTISTSSSGQEEDDYVLFTEVHKEESVIKTTVSVQDVHNDSTLFNKHYRSQTDSFFSLIEKIAAELPAEIISTDSVSESAGSPNLSSELMNDYVKALSLYQKNTHENTDKAVKIFKNILKQDSSFVPAYTGLARCYLQIIYEEWDRNLVWLHLAQNTNRKALKKGDSAEPYIIQGKVYLKFGDYKQAEQHFCKAIKVNPNLGEAWVGLGKVYIYYGLYNPCIKVYSTALDLNPDDIDSRISLSMLQIGLKKYEDSFQTIEQGLNRDPHKLFLHSFLGLILFYQNDLHRAEKEILKGLNSTQYSVFSHSVSAMIQAKKGNQDQALTEVELEVKPYVNNNASLATAVAAVYALIDRKGLAVQWIEKAHEFGYKEYLWLVNDPNYNNLRDDHRFMSIMDTIKKEWEQNLEQYKTSET